MSDDSSVGGVTTTGSDAGSAASPAAPQGSTAIDTGAGSPNTPSVDPQTTPGSDPATAPGPIPYDRFKQVNTRMQEAERRIKEWEASHGEVLKLPAEQVKAMREFAADFQADPVQTVMRLNERLQSDARYGPQLASAAARMLQARRGQGQPAQVGPEPEPDLVAENGQPVYSAPQLKKWQQWSAQQMEAKILQRLAPLEQQARSTAEERQRADLVQRSNAQADKLLAQAKTWHGFEAHQDAILEAFKSHEDWTLQDAYLSVLHSKILPAMPAQAQATVVADLQQKAAAQTLNPAGGAPASTPDFGGDFKKALTFYAGKK